MALPNRDPESKSSSSFTAMLLQVQNLASHGQSLSEEEIDNLEKQKAIERCKKLTADSDKLKAELLEELEDDILSMDNFNQLLQLLQWQIEILTLNEALERGIMPINNAAMKYIHDSLLDIYNFLKENVDNRWDVGHLAGLAYTFANEMLELNKLPVADNFCEKANTAIDKFTSETSEFLKGLCPDSLTAATELEAKMQRNNKLLKAAIIISVCILIGVFLGAMGGLNYAVTYMVQQYTHATMAKIGAAIGGTVGGCLGGLSAFFNDKSNQNMAPKVQGVLDVMGQKAPELKQRLSASASTAKLQPGRS